MRRTHSWFGLGLVMAAGLAAPQAAVAQAGDTLRVEISAIPGIKFDRVRFQATPGTTVQIVFHNRDDLADMDHNLVVTNPGARMDVVLAGMQASVERSYVPDVPEVIAHTPLVKQGETAILTFTAPSAPGAYPYVCTFPGHGYVMYGVMYVGQDMPSLASDENVPPTQRTGQDMPLAGGGRPGGPGGAGGGGGPPAPPPPGPPVSYGTTFPAVSRTFMPESGPASIAVGFDDGQSFNFDAGAGYLRYAWTGGFVDNWPHWQGNGNAYATVIGDVYFRDQIGVPLRIGSRDDAGKVKFEGYRLESDDVPEFRYRLDGAEVRERIDPRQGGGLVRTFHIETTEPVRFVTSSGAGVRFESSVGRWQDGVLTLTAAQAREFKVTMIPTEGGPQ